MSLPIYSYIHLPAVISTLVEHRCHTILRSQPLRARYPLSIHNRIPIDFGDSHTHVGNRVQFTVFYIQHCHHRKFWLLLFFHIQKPSIIKTKRCISSFIYACRIYQNLSHILLQHFFLHVRNI